MPGTWTPLANQPTFNASTMLLLTDGTVMCQDAGPSATGSPNWYRLSPDASGSYVNGAWTPLAKGPNSPQFYVSAVMRDGRVFVAGGEYNGSGNTADLLAAEIYDPVADKWTPIATPPGWTKIGDAASCMLTDGSVLLGAIPGNGNNLDNATAIYDPASNTWRASAAKNNSTSNEETWTLLPDGTILTLDCFGHPLAEKYLIASDKWIAIGNTPVDLVEDSSKEIGPAILLNDGRVFAIGASGATVLYTVPAEPTDPGNWQIGPVFSPRSPGQTLIAKDAPACLLPNGRVLCVAGPAVCDPVNQGFCPPTYFYEFDPSSLQLAAVADSPNNSTAPFSGRMLLLPTGQVLFSNGSNDIEVYTPDGVPAQSWKPTIATAPSAIAAGSTFTLRGTQLNGLSQAVSYGDDAQQATNYPLVRIRNLARNRITYGRTFNHSTMGVATGTTIQSTQVQVPPGIDRGPAELSVVANGIASDALPVTVQ